MHRTYTDEEWAELYCEGKPPKDAMRIVKWAWETLPMEVRLKMLETQPVIIFDRPNLGTSNHNPRDDVK